MTLKPFCSTLAGIAVVAPIFLVPPVQAATPSSPAQSDEEPLHRVRADLDKPSLAVRLGADGSVVVSQGIKAGGAVITLASVQALPAEIDTLVPRKEDRKKLAVTVDPAGSYRNFIGLMNETREAGFGEVGVLELEKKQPNGVLPELKVRLSPKDLNLDPKGKPLFVSVGNDGIVVLTLGIGAEATGMNVSLAGASDAVAGMVPKDRAKKPAYFRADFEVPLGNALGLLRKLRRIGFTDICIVGEATQ
jgi:biopolymer transport protein ExbD